ncbi:hypothetical protein BJ508DRAFT_337152 [Ascobolus immersus RN42]|uniref:Uncharacterized protein n=1 Tax=Ascobolus immersus RN42 TaxID=1160509 RepID=A0A3N4HB57_ASCIM|nr:hypothetical protein BJ508DRAFT_337152 [Ascobolus immersus RN42]
MALSKSTVKSSLPNNIPIDTKRNRNHPPPSRRRHHPQLQQDSEEGYEGDSSSNSDSDSELDEDPIGIKNSVTTIEQEPENLYPPRYDDLPTVVLPPPRPPAPAPTPGKRITPLTLRLKRPTPPTGGNEPLEKRRRRSSWVVTESEHFGLSPSKSDEADWDSSYNTFLNLPRSPKHPFVRFDYPADSEASTIRLLDLEYSARSESEASTILESAMPRTVDPARTILVAPSEEGQFGGSDKENIKP